MTRVVICGTYPTQYNGYSKVLYELVKELSKFPELQIFYFGFQNYGDNKAHEEERALPRNVEVYDAYKNEEPKQKGFGDTLIEAYVKEKDPDIVMVYNDLVVLTSFLDKLHKIEPRKFKIIPYIDLVYQNEKNALIQFVNNHCDAGVFFTKYWEKVAKGQGFVKPSYVMEHGFNRDNHYPIPKRVARAYFNIPDDQFVITNLNRNQPRKRWDICIMAFVKFISNHMDEPIKLIIGTALQGAWDLVDIFVSECRKYGLDPEVAKNHLIMVQNPQHLTDKEVNVLYNVADVGLNTCDGEGFGLCNFEQAAIGIPQLVPAIGGFRDFFDKDTAIMIQPKWSYYVESTRDAVGGEGQICDIEDIVSALEMYYGDSDLRKTIGAKAREKICKNYTWSGMADKLRDVFKEYGPAPAPTPVPVLEAQPQPLPAIAEETASDASSDKNVDLSTVASESVVTRPMPTVIGASSLTEKPKKGLFTELEVIDSDSMKQEAEGEKPVAPQQPEKQGHKDVSEEDSESDEELDVAALMAMQKKINKILKKVVKK